MPAKPAAASDPRSYTPPHLAEKILRDRATLEGERRTVTALFADAIAMQRAFAEHNESAEEPIMVRVGLNAGEPIAEDEDLFGTAVNEAARITATADGGEILVSNVVRELAKGKDFLFADRGEANLKGFDEPVRLFEVRWREAG